MIRARGDGWGMRRWVGGFLDRGVGVAAVVLFAGLALARLDPRVPAHEESAGEWVRARAVAEGEGYRDLAHPDRPRSGDPFPLYTLALAPLVAQDASTGALKALSVVAGAAALGLFWAFARRRLGTHAAAGVALALAVSPVYGAVSVALLPDALLVFWLALALYATTRWEEGGLWFGVALASGAFAFLTDLRGAALLLGLAAALGLRGRWTRLGWALGVAGLLAAAALLWSCVVADPGGRGSCVAWLYVDPRNPHWGLLGPADVVRRLMANLAGYGGALPEALLGPAPGPWALVAGIVAVVFASLVLIGWFGSLRGARPLEWTLAALGGLALLAPAGLASPRMLAPAIPLALVCAVEGAREVASFIPRVTVRPVDLLVGAALAGLALPQSVREVVVNRGCLRSVGKGNAHACIGEEWTGFFEMAEAARVWVPPEALVISGHPQLLFRLSGRRAVSFLGRGERADLWAFVDSAGARYILIDPASPEEQGRILTALRADPGRVEVVHRAGAPPATLLRVRGGGPRPTGSG